MTSEEIIKRANAVDEMDEPEVLVGKLLSQLDAGGNIVVNHGFKEAILTSNPVDCPSCPW